MTIFIGGLDKGGGTGQGVLRYLISNSKDAAKGYEYYNNRNSINITQKYYDEHTDKQMPAEIIKDFLYWVASDEVPKSDDEAYYFCTDNSTELKYDPFHKDFGPLNLAMTHRFCCELTKVLFEKKDTDWKIYHYTSTNGEKMANSACLIGVFMVVILQRTPEEAWEVLKDYHHSITPFRDATAGICTYNLTILEVLKGLEKAMELGWYNFKTFDVQEYEYYEKLDNGDLNWVIPGKICAFMGPWETNYDTNGLRCHTPEDYSKLFESLGVERIIRLNEK